MELTPGDIVPANPLDLAGRTLVFTPDGRGGYSRSVRALAWEEDIGNPVDDNEEIEPNFRFDFAGRQWESFFVSRYGLVTFGEPYPFPRVGPDQRGTMQEIAVHLGTPPLIAALYKPRLGGNFRLVGNLKWDEDQHRNTQHVARSPDRIVITWITSDPPFHVHGVPPQEKTRFQLALHADGHIALHYAPEPKDPDEAIRDGIVGLFPSAKTGLLGSIPDPVDRHLPGYLDLVETGLYTMVDPTHVLVEFTTRGPIPAIPDQRLFYDIVIHTDEADGRTIRAGAFILPDGRRLPTGAARTAYGGDADGNRIGAVIDLRIHTLSGIQASVVARTWARSDTEETRSGNEWSPPAIISFPDVAASPTTDLSRPGSSAVQLEVFHHTRAKDQVEPKTNLFPVACRVIEVLGDEFDGFVFHSQFRYDIQYSGHQWAHFPGNVPTRGVGFTEGELERRTSPCGRRMRGQWRYSDWTKSDHVAVSDGSGGYIVDPHATWTFAHEFTHTWTAYASYLRNGEPGRLSDGVHWLRGLHTPGAFVSSGALMGGNLWRENPDGTFTPLYADPAEVGHSWLDLYLAGLATPDEVPDTFILRNLRPPGRGSRGPHTAEKEIVTIEQVVAALGPRDPPAARSQKVFNIGFIYLLEPDQALDQDQLRFHALFLDAAVEHWDRSTGGRSRLTAEPPDR